MPEEHFNEATELFSTEVDNPFVFGFEQYALFFVLAVALFIAIKYLRN